MKFQYLGTAAAEGIPAVFCTCERCKRSWEIGGRALRTRSQAIIDGRLLIDFPADAYAHALAYGVDYSKIHHLLMTHSHSDHLYPTEFEMMRNGFSHLPDDYRMTVYGGESAWEKLEKAISPKLTESGLLSYRTIVPFDEFDADKYHIVALPARHDKGSSPLFYQISDGQKTMLYAHDTHYFVDEVWDFWEKTKPHFDFVSLDCTNAMLPLTYIGHMGLVENVEVKKRMIDMGIADDSTKFVCNHFSHNGLEVVYDDFVPIAAKEGFMTSYDGMKIEF
jgi:phosphoribosyl 1,2-cyclic phosphate phosphodiesterase